MPNLRLLHPVFTLDNQVLFAPGTVLTRNTLDDALSSFRRIPCKTCSLLSFSTVKEDLLNFLSVPPYVTIFFDQRQIDELMNLLDSIDLPVPVLESIDYFKQNDFQTYCHILMVFALSTLLTKLLLSDARKRIRVAATGPTHDIGKICVPLSVLQKTAPLTKKEKTLLEHHTVAGYVLLSHYSNNSRRLACKVALEHHEREDGSGYPRGIMLKDILVEIITVSDIYDALIAPRPYRSSAYDNRTALEEITRMAKEKKLRWDVVKALISVNRESKPDHTRITISGEKRGTPPFHNVHGITSDV